MVTLKDPSLQKYIMNCCKIYIFTLLIKNVTNHEFKMCIKCTYFIAKVHQIDFFMNCGARSLSLENLFFAEMLHREMFDHFVHFCSHKTHWGLSSAFEMALTPKFINSLCFCFNMTRLRVRESQVSHSTWTCFQIHVCKKTLGGGCKQRPSLTDQWRKKKILAFPEVIVSFVQNVSFKGIKK